MNAASYGATREGFRNLGDGAGIYWAVFGCEDDAREFAAEFGGGEYDGPGRAFSRRASVYGYGKRWVVSQFSGLDI